MLYGPFFILAKIFFKIFLQIEELKKQTWVFRPMLCI